MIVGLFQCQKMVNLNGDCFYESVGNTGYTFENMDI